MSFIDQSLSVIPATSAGVRRSSRRVLPLLLRLLEVIKADIREIEGDSLRMLTEVTGSKVT
jgi:hypothetical protein